MKPITSLLDYRRKIDKEKQRHLRVVTRLARGLTVFQSKCKHKHTGFQVDPAGGGDSFTWCLACDKKLD